MKTINKLKEDLRSARIYLFDFKNDRKYTSLISDVYDNQEKLLSSLVVAAHTIEKGLTMPHKRIPFGEPKAIEIINNCAEYVKRGYDVSESRFIDVIGIMEEYKDVMGEAVSSRFKDSLNGLLNYIPHEIQLTQKYSINREEYFSHIDDDFVTFSRSRCSCRNLPGHVNKEALKRALALSMNAPSTCNRQSHRVHLLQTEESKKTILSIQSGNRGFGDIADQFILVTSDLRCWPSKHQRNAPYVDGGIYIMNLLYCLHHEKIAACTLNLYLDENRTNKMHEELGIPDNEVPIALVAIGIPPESFDLARSHRRSCDEIITCH